MWRIEPSGPRSAAFVSFMGEIAYGRIPEGYVQKFPRRGPAVPLDLGKVYDFFAETTNASGATGFF